MDRGIRIKGQVCLSQVREVVLWNGLLGKVKV